MDTSRLAAVVCGLVDGAGVGLAVFLSALAVKLLDDLIDSGPREADIGPRGAAPAVYAAVLLVAAAALAPATTVALFFGAYAVGMLAAPAERQPSGLRGWVESGAAVLLSGAAVGPMLAAGALLIMLAIQAADDLVDLAEDRQRGRVSLAVALGRPGATAVAAVGGGLAVALHPPLGLAAFTAAGPIIAGWLPPGRSVARGRSANRFRLAAGGVATMLTGAVATMLVPGTRVVETGADVITSGAVAQTALGGWLQGELGGAGLLVAVAVVTAVVGGAVPAAYRHGQRDRSRRESMGAEALAALWKRADRLEED